MRAGIRALIRPAVPLCPGPAHIAMICRRGLLHMRVHRTCLGRVKTIARTFDRDRSTLDPWAVGTGQRADHQQGAWMVMQVVEDAVSHKGLTFQSDSFCVLYREVEFRYFLVFFVLKFKNSKILVKNWGEI